MSGPILEPAELTPAPPARSTPHASPASPASPAATTPGATAAGTGYPAAPASPAAPPSGAPRPAVAAPSTVGRAPGRRPMATRRAPAVPVGPGRPGDPPMTTDPEPADAPMATSPDPAAWADTSPYGDYPLQPAKVQRPFLRDETLERGRLLDWLHRRIHSRLVLVTAEAGYGKTTLLADFSRRTRVRTAWYRLDELDRNTISFLHYLVAAGRELDPEFAPGTASLLRELGTTAVSEDRIVETFLRELARLGQQATALIVDDYHLVDDVPEVRRLMRQVIANAPERLTVVLVSRRRPLLPLARLRSLGEVAELHADDLRFSREETELLFRDAYGEPLEADVLTDLTRRTEGWAASLELVRTALHGRNAVEIRSFVRSLSGASQELYDYLAEEVVGDLEPQAQQFLMRTAILQVVRPDLAAVASGLGEDDARGQIAAAERLGLLGGRGVRAPRSHRYHPLVRDFLLHRLAREIGEMGMAELHLVVARHADGRDWVLAAHHYAEAGEQAEVRRVIADSLAEIMGRGEFALAESYLTRYPPDEPNAAFEVIQSRLEYSGNRSQAGLSRARGALHIAEASGIEDVALANLMALTMLTGDIEGARRHAEELASQPSRPTLTAIAASVLAATASSVDGSVRESVDRLRDMAADQTAHGLRHYAAVTHVNLAVALRVLGDQLGAIDAASEALSELDTAETSRPEAFAARSARAAANAHLGAWAGAQEDLLVATRAPHDLARAEALIEAADTYAWYESQAAAYECLELAEPLVSDSAALRSMWSVSKAQLLVRSGRLAEAEACLGMSSIDQVGAMPGLKARRLLIEAERLFCQSRFEAKIAAEVARRHSAAQQAGLWERAAALLAALCTEGRSSDTALQRLLRLDPGSVSMMADYVAPNIGSISETTMSLLAEEVARRPERWLPLLRPLLSGSTSSLALRAASLIELVGNWDDVRALRQLARRLRLSGGDKDLGKVLARQLSVPVYIEDLGPLAYRVGPRLIPGTEVRRKVSALVCFLLSRPQLVATKDQVLEALWPDQDPSAAANSLNQTVYFLRRLLDGNYEDDVSVPYVMHSTEMLRLDRGLVSSASVECAEILFGPRVASDDAASERLSSLYSGRFALDFEYEEWAASYRDALHAAYLEAIERTIRTDIAAGDYGRAMRLAQRALLVDPDAEQIELSLLRLYRLAGAHSAAAEQYQHYAGRMRAELGVEPPSLEELWADK
jgi:ATP/maltotriose-dependent transcriptional regulator MalT/DNA-binding SARP family transcriptional activator